MQRIPGKQIAQEILDELKDRIHTKQIKPKLGVLLVGEDPASALYVSLKRKAADKIGILTDFRQLATDTPDAEIIKIIQGWNVDQSVHGILIQMPIHEGHDAVALVNAMDPNKDADGFHPANVEALKNGEAKVISPLHEGILRLIAATPIEPNHSLCIILANTHTFADPLKYILERAGATVEVVLADHTSTSLSAGKDDKRLREADIIVVAVGKEKFLTSNGVKPGACIIDVGINKTADGKIRGDFDSEACADMDGFYSPVPGGVGPMTVALLMKNVVEMAG